jgi:hypothetical protein
MLRAMALALIVSIAFATTPLAARSRQSGPPPSKDTLRAYVGRLPIGSLVKVTPTQGRSFKAILMVVDDEAIVVKPKTRVPRPERRLALTELEFVEPVERNNTAKSVGIGLATGIGTFLAMILITFAIVED